MDSLNIHELRVEAIGYFQKLHNYISQHKTNRFYIKQRDAIKLRHVLNACVTCNRHQCEQSLEYDWYDGICIMFENGHIEEYVLNNIDAEKLYKVLRIVQGYKQQPQLI